MENKFLCFIHLEKCGGITLHHLIQNNLPTYVNLRSWFYWSNIEGNYLRKDELRNLLRILPFIEGVGGHVARTFAGYEKVINKPIFYLTFLREPVSRYISHCNYQKQVMKISWSIEDFVEERRFNNYQVVRLTGKENLDEAKRVLREDIDFFGLIERFDESLLLLKEIYGGGISSVNYEKYNVAKRIPNTMYFDNLSNKIKKRIIDNNKLDIELYNYAKDILYPGFKNAYSDNLEDDLILFQKENRRYRQPRVKSSILFIYRNLLRYIVQPIVHKYSIK